MCDGPLRARSHPRRFLSGSSVFMTDAGMHRSGPPLRNPGPRAFVLRPVLRRPCAASARSARRSRVFRGVSSHVAAGRQSVHKFLPAPECAFPNTRGRAKAGSRHINAAFLLGLTIRLKFMATAMNLPCIAHTRRNRTPRSQSSIHESALTAASPGRGRSRPFALRHFDEPFQHARPRARRTVPGLAPARGTCGRRAAVKGADCRGISR